MDQNTCLPKKCDWYLRDNTVSMLNFVGVPGDWGFIFNHNIWEAVCKFQDSQDYLVRPLLSNNKNQNKCGCDKNIVENFRMHLFLRRHIPKDLDVDYHGNFCNLWAASCLRKGKYINIYNCRCTCECWKRTDMAKC